MQKRLHKNVRFRRRVCSVRAGDTSERVRYENERAAAAAPCFPHKMFRVLQVWLTPHARR